MGFVELAVIALGLSMDACAVAICKGLSMKQINYRQAVIIALFFGGFQALMPLLGWALGVQFQHYITAIDHWIAFVLLGFIGGKMIFDALRGGSDEAEVCEQADQKLEIKQLFVLAIATSIDALAVGIAFASLQVDIVPAIVLIGVITFVLAFVGVVIGNRFGAKFERLATLAGGTVLVVMGLKILLEHLGIFG